MQRTVALDELLRKQSPLALVRAVELAEGLVAGEAAKKKHGAQA